MNPVTLVRLLEPPVFLASIVVLIWLSVPEANPIAVTGRPVWRFFTRKNYFIYVTIGLIVIAIDLFMNAIDHDFTTAVLRWRGDDFTSLVWRMEGRWVQYFQQWTWTPLTWYLGWAYIIAFPAMVPWAMAVFDWLGERRKVIAVLAAYIMNYILVLPFYIFVPVVEPHSYPPAHASLRLLLDDIDPAVMEVLRPASGIDNCFPSFHTSLAVTMAIFAWRSGRKAFAAVMAVIAVSVVVSTLYLGIHWLIDVGAGILVGILAYLFGAWFSRRYWTWWTRRGAKAT